MSFYKITPIGRLSKSTEIKRYVALGCFIFCLAPLKADEVKNTNKSLSLYEALSISIEKNSNVLLSRSQVNFSQGVAKQQSGAFDIIVNGQAGVSRSVIPNDSYTAGNSVYGTGLIIPYAETDKTYTQAGITKQFSNGVQVSILGTQNSIDSNVFAAQGDLTQNQGLLTFQVVVPLLKNSGGAVSSGLRAAEVESLASQDDLEFTVNQMVLNSALAYWDYLGKTKLVEISTKNEKDAENSIKEYQKLIAADQLPKSEVVLADASLKEKKATRLAYEQALIEARRTLGRSLGMDAQSTMAIETLSDPFPDDQSEKIEYVLTDLDQIIQNALEKRGDIKAAKKRIEKYEILVDAAQKNQRPQLDLALSMSQQGLAQGYSPDQGSSFSQNYGSSFGQHYGPGYGGFILFQMPINNNAARGLTQQQQALLRSYEITLVELGYAVTNNIQVATQGMLNSYDRLKEAKAAVEKYQTSVNNERTKRRLGLSTLLDVLNVEDRYNNAQIALVQSQIAYASSIAVFRFQTNRIMERDGENYALQVSNLLNPYLRNSSTSNK
jgi:outer membrane protein TolC